MVQKAKDIGLETRVCDWIESNVFKDICDFYYDISILNKEQTIKICDSLAINDIISVASDYAMPSVNYFANKLNLVGYSIWFTEVTNLVEIIGK